jgi:signal transduction histidine kinase
VKIRLNWQKRAIIIFAAVILFLSVVLTIFAIREAEREKLVREKEIEEEQQRSAELIIDQVNSVISETEGRIIKQISSSQVQSHGTEFTEVCRRIAEGEEIVDEIFLIKEKGEVIFPLFKPLFFIAEERQNIRERPIKIEANPLFKKAEASEFKTKNYPLAIRSYQKLMDTASDNGSRAVLLNHIGRSYTKSGKHLKAIEAYQKILKEYPDEVSSDGIPLGIIALYQIGSIYLNIDRKINWDEAFFELYKNLLESRWPLTKSQFYFYRNKVKDILKTSMAEIAEQKDEKGLLKRLEKLQMREEEQLNRMNHIENLIQKVFPLIETKRSAASSVSGSFYHISETIGKEIYLVSYTPLAKNLIFGVKINSEVLAERLLPLILGKLSLREDWLVQVRDEFGNVLAGQDMTNLQEPVPPLSYSEGFEDNFIPWKINIYQIDPGLAERQFNLRRNIYILTVAVVIVAILFGGFLAIRSIAKELQIAKLKSEFVSTVSHEFRTPLTSIRYLAELLQRGRVQEDNKKQQYYETITSESERLSRLIENILDFSKIEAGMKEYKFEETDIAKLAEDVADRFGKQVAGEKFVTEQEISNQMPKVFVDKEAVSRALFNLFDNAFKYSGGSLKAYLRVWSDRENIFLEVKDKGIGISKQDQAKIFEKFYRSGDVHHTSIKGSGIGLTLVAHIIKAHGGDVLLESG